MSNESTASRTMATASEVSNDRPEQMVPSKEIHIGFIGIGAMGLPMANNLHRAGYTVSAVDPSARQCALAQDAGYSASDDLDDLRGSDAVIVMVANPEQLLGLVEPLSLLENKNHRTVAIVASTVGPRALEDFAQRMGEHGVEVIDVAVTGGVAGAERGGLTLLTGAPTEALQRVRPLLECLGSITNCGDRPGDGQAVKLVNNLLAAVNSAAVAEAIRFTKGLGLDPQRVLECIEHGAAASWMLSDRGPRMAQPREEREFRTQTAILAKDTTLIQHVAAEHGTNVPLLSIVQGQFAKALDLGWATEDDSAIVDLPL